MNLLFNRKRIETNEFLLLISRESNISLLSISLNKLRASLNGTEIIHMIIKVRIIQHVLASAGFIFSLGADLISLEILTKMNFRPNVPGIINASDKTVQKVAFVGAVSEDAHLAHGDMNDHISVVSDSPGFRNAVNNSGSKVKVSDSRGAISVQMELFFSDDTVARKVKSSQVSQSTTQTVSSDEIFEIRILLDHISHMSLDLGSENLDVVIVEITHSLGVFNGGAHGEGNAGGIRDFVDELGVTNSSSEGKDKSLSVGIDETGKG